jgi:hypothetical protein
MAPSLRRAALRRLALRAATVVCLVVALGAAVAPPAWLGVDPFVMRAALIASALALGLGALALRPRRARPRATAPRAALEA